MNVLIRKVVLGSLSIRGSEVPLLLKEADVKIMQGLATLLGVYHQEQVTLEIFHLHGEYLKRLNLSKKYCQVSVEKRRHALEEARLYGSLARKKMLFAARLLAKLGCMDVYFCQSTNDCVVIL